MAKTPETGGDPHAVAQRQPAAPAGRRPADTFAARLVLARHLNGLNLKQAAELTGINDGTWATWEAGRRPRDILDICRRIANALEIDHDWLLFGGPLAGPRGVPTKRTGSDNVAKGRVAVRPTDSRPRDTRPPGRPPQVPPMPSIDPTQRRPVRINRPLAA